MNRATMLFMRWITATLILLSLADFGWGIATGRRFSIITGLTCAVVNALTAEFWRRKLGAEEGDDPR